MRAFACVALILVGLVQTAWAAATAPELVSRAVQALNTTCYEARMRYMSQFEGGEIQKVHIWHVAPELYRVEPLVRDRSGNWNTSGLEYYENGQELMRYNRATNHLEAMPVRQFSVTDNLTVKFLRDLADSPDVSVLEGWVGDYAVYFLRHDLTKERPYSIAVGLDRTNYFPLFLVVTDGEGRQRVYYEMEAIEYRKPQDLPVSMFQAPADQERIAGPRMQRNKAASTAPVAEAPAPMIVGPPFPEEDALPWYPAWLPEGFQVEGLLRLNYVPDKGLATKPSLVYQFEIFGPQMSDMVSLFQTRASDIGMDLDSCGPVPAGVLVEQRGDWIITIFGDLDPRVLSRIIDNLAADPEQVDSLLRQTQERDEIYDRALEP